MAYVVCAKWTAKEGKEDRLAEICEEMTEPSRAEDLLTDASIAAIERCRDLLAGVLGVASGR